MCQTGRPLQVFAPFKNTIKMSFVVFATSESCPACGSFFGMLSELQVGAVLYGHFRGDSYSEIEEVLKRFDEALRETEEGFEERSHRIEEERERRFEELGEREEEMHRRFEERIHELEERAEQSHD